MSFSGLLNSLWNSKSDGNKSNVSNNPPPMRGTQGLQGSPGLRGTQNTQDIYSQTDINKSVPISQGKEYMLYKQSKVNRVNNEINSFNVNGNQNYISNYNSNSISNSNSNYGNIREGFDGMIGPSQVNKKNQQDSSNRQSMEDEFNRSISSYATSQRNLMDKSQQFLQGKRTYGKNIHALQAANTDDIIPNWVGCYKSGNDGLIEQTDLGNNTNLTDCKVRASDLGYSTFALRQKGDSPGNTCFVGDNIDKAQSGGIATKSVLSYSFKKAEGANIGGLMMNGQIGMYEDDITNDLVTDLTAVANCDISIGGKINPNTSVATYGYNCNGTQKSPYTAPPPQQPQEIPTPDGYTKYPNKDSGGNDIIKLVDGTSIADLAAACDKNENCSGFNNGGWVKSVIKPEEQWGSGNWNGKQLDLYVKNPKPPKLTTQPEPTVNCSKYGEGDTNLPDECYNEIWKSVCPAPMPPTNWWRTQTKQAVQLNMYQVSTMPDPRLRAMCYTIPPEPVVKTGSTINTNSIWSKSWVSINDGTNANSLSQLNDGTIICTNSAGYVYTRPNISTAWTQISGGPSQGNSTPSISSGWNGKCIDQDRGNQGNGLQMQLYDCNGGSNQQFVYNNSNQTVTVPGGLCLDVAGAGTGNGTQVIQWGCHGGSNQRWVYGADKTLRPQHTSGKCLDALGFNNSNGAKIGIWDCNGAVNQTWNINKKVDNPVILMKSVIQLLDGTYLGVGKNDNMLYVKNNLTDIWNGYNPLLGLTKSNPVRYVKININKNNECLQISQLAVYSNGVNIAPGKTASAPNIYSSQSIPAKAIDGTLSTRDYPNIYHSACRSGDYWLLDLGKEYDVDKIVYYNRRDCCSERANGMVVQIFDNNMSQKQFPTSNFTLNSDMVQTITLNNVQKPDPSTCCVISVTQTRDGTIIGVGTDNSLYKKKSLASKWTKITCPQSCCVTSISTLNDGSIVGVGTNGLIYTRKSLDSVWTLVDSSMQMSSVTQLKDGTILGTSQSGSFFRK
jgi:hypothetical protein